MLSTAYCNPNLRIVWTMKGLLRGRYIQVIQGIREDLNVDESIEKRNTWVWSQLIRRKEGSLVWPSVIKKVAWPRQCFTATDYPKNIKKTKFKSLKFIKIEYLWRRKLKIMEDIKKLSIHVTKIASAKRYLFNCFRCNINRDVYSNNMSWIKMYLFHR